MGVELGTRWRNDGSICVDPKWGWRLGCAVDLSDGFVVVFASAVPYRLLRCIWGGSLRCL